MIRSKLKENAVFIYSLSIICIIVLWGLLAPEHLGACAESAFSVFVTGFGWMYLLAVSFFLVFCIWLFFSPYRKLRLGADDSRPEFSNLSWFAMLFSAGMAIGLIFWGVAEPVSHIVAPPGQVTPASREAIVQAFRLSFFHWGFHAWANYALFALAMAYFQLRKGYPGLVSSIFIPLFGRKIMAGPLGKAIDILAIFATVAGISTDLGLGTLQINSGLNYLYNVPISMKVQVAIIVAITIGFMISAVKGLDKGIKTLSDFNMWLVALLMIGIFMVGPQKEMFLNLFMGSKAYMQNIIFDSFPFERLRNNSEWMGSWTVFYWAWWIAWTPFVGTFIARISWGRTIGEFLAGVLIIPTLGSMIWFAEFGTLSMGMPISEMSDALSSIPTAYFSILARYPFSGPLSLLTIVLLVTFFITSADSSTFVLGILSSGGNPNPTTLKKITWGVVQSLMALALLMAGGLEILQTASIVAAFPFAIVMVLSVFSLLKSLREEKHSLNTDETRVLKKSSTKEAM